MEIIEEAPSDSIIPVDSKKRVIRPIGDEEALQKLVEQVGSPLNIDLARLFVSQRFLIWEGDESSRKILSAFQSILYPEELHPLITYPKAYVKGWEDWDKVRAITEVFSANNTQIKCFTIFNSYMSSKDEVAALTEDAKKDHVNLHVWEKSEIENYAINTEAILRYINHSTTGKSISERELKSAMQAIFDELLEYYPDIKEIEDGTKAFNYQASIVPGRQFFSRLSQWTKVNAGVSISALQVVLYFQQYEVPAEIIDVINTIVKGFDF